jgi:hypothetical protein
MDFAMFNFPQGGALRVAPKRCIWSDREISNDSIKVSIVIHLMFRRYLQHSFHLNEVIILRVA